MDPKPLSEIAVTELRFLKTLTEIRNPIPQSTGGSHPGQDVWEGAAYKVVCVLAPIFFIVLRDVQLRSGERRGERVVHQPLPLLQAMTENGSRGGYARRQREVSVSDECARAGGCGV